LVLSGDEWLSDVKFLRDWNCGVFELHRWKMHFANIDGAHGVETEAVPEGTMPVAYWVQLHCRELGVILAVNKAGVGDVDLVGLIKELEWRAFLSAKQGIHQMRFL